MPRVKVETRCDWCEGTFLRVPAHARGKRYCSTACSGAARRKYDKVEGVCEECGERFSRNSHGAKEAARFCSRRCGAVFRSRERRNTGGRLCPQCGGRKTYSGQMCRSCRVAISASRTLDEFRADRPAFAFHAALRGLSRDAYRGPMECLACGYSVHVDVCHVRPVADFPGTAKLAEVNAPENLIALDRRCHWEFDHGYLAYVDGVMVSTVPTTAAAA